MDIDIEQSATLALVQLASAQDRIADDIEKVVQHAKEINGHVREHATQLALGSQWMKSHMGDDGAHTLLKEQIATLKKQIAENRKLAKTAVAVQIVLALGLAIGTIVIAAR